MLDLPQDEQASAEIQITRKMIREGVWILTDFDWGWDDPGEYAEKIFKEMLSVSPQFGQAVVQRVR